MAIFKDSFQSQIYDIVKNDILEKKFKFGEQINPKKIAEEHGISVMPVRDALLQLVNQGLVINKKRVGFFVRDFSRTEAIEIMEVRKMYELYGMGEFFESIDRKHLSEMYDKIKNDSKLSKSELYEIDFILHNSFILASNNQFLIDEYERVKNLFILFLYYDTTRDNEAREEHCNIIEAILNQDKVSSLTLLRNHLDRVKSVIVENGNFKELEIRCI